MRRPDEKPEVFAWRRARHGCRLACLPAWKKDQGRDAAWEWVCLAWVSLFWVWDARRGCPIYGQGAKKSAWRYLETTLHTLARAITEPGDGTGELAWPAYALMSDIIYGGKQ